jgi:hypothetical protein
MKIQKRSLEKNQMRRGVAVLSFLIAASCGPADEATTRPSTGGDGGKGGSTSSQSGSGGSSSTGGQGNTSSSTGGTSGSAGSSGSGGSTTVASGDCATPSLAANEELISDFEDGTGLLAEGSGRAGGFYMYNDMTAGAVQDPAPSQTATIMPKAGGRCSKMAMTTKGMGFTNWGAGMGTDLNNVYDSAAMKGNKKAYDASAYTGFSFWARIAEGTTAKMIRVNLADGDTEAAGGKCTPPKCDDHFGKWITFTSTWAKYTMTFAEMKQQGFGAPVAAFDASKVYAVQFQTKQATTFDVWVDDLAFVKK